MHPLAARCLASLATLTVISSQLLAQTSELTGTWRLKSITDTNTGEDDKLWGPAPKGLLILDGNGFFSQHQMRADRPKYAAPGRLGGSSEDHKRAAEQTLSYFGTYKVDAARKVIAFTYEGSSWPNVEGTTAQREFILSEGELKTLNPAPAGSPPITLTWMRAR
ncbi:MAG: hypothetical protein JWN07_429 [Hyphomicrobiales bacterium]|nr:hypothetical protein [Hyphomicrobiales bacterium]